MKKNERKFFFLIIILPVFSWLLLFLIFKQKTKEFDELAFGTETINSSNKFNNFTFLCSSAEDIGYCLEYINNNSFKKKILWIGNSQLNGINQGNINSKNAPYRVTEHFYKKQIGIITFAAPNMSFVEYLEVVNYFLDKVNFDYILLSAVFDDTREYGVRNNLIVKEKKIIEEKVTINEIIEKKIVNFLDKKISWSSVRSNAQLSIFEFLYRLRNTIFGITPSSIREMKKPFYEKNINALYKVFERLNNNKINGILYIAPLRQDVEIPYNQKEYNQFKDTINDLAKNFSLEFFNLENSILPNLWGVKGGTKLSVEDELDFMHFNEEGHSLFAQEIIKILGNVEK